MCVSVCVCVQLCFSLLKFNIQSELITNITITDNAHRSIRIDGWMDYVQYTRHSSQTHNKNSRSIQNAPGLKSIPETAGMNAQLL